MTLSLLTLVRVVFLISLGAYLVSLRHWLPVTAGVCSMILGVLVALGEF